ncbi:MFS transporter [Antricoccus suffuscus]|uniref:MFS transporter n=2 Tax=Antricoccus suffuscus TaxID=1629062 RepID=A0A2T1A2U8_9ACTN|nr:MFS transporter [Antricoccus suffuscus]
MNSGMIAVALSTMRGELKLNPASIMWVITIYYLASAILQPLMGRLADRYGPRKLFLFGMGVIVAVGIVGPFASTLLTVCIARVFLAMGTATAFPSAAAMLRGIAASSGKSAPKMIGRIQMIDTGASAIGPVIGGLLVTHMGWQSVFWVNIPFAALALISSLFFAPEDGVRAKVPLRSTIVESDVPGVAAFAVAVVALLTFLLELPTAPIWWLLPLTLVAGAVFVWRESRCVKPFIDLQLLGANTELLMVYLRFALINIVFYGALFGVPQFLDDHGGYRTDVVGILVVPLAAFTLLLTPYTERLIERTGLRHALVVGGVGLFASTVLSMLLVVSTAPYVVLVVTAAMGIPYCILTISLTQSLYVAANPDEVGEAAGLFQLSRCIAGICSTAVVGIAFASGSGATAWLYVAGAITILAFGYLLLVLGRQPRQLRPA